MTASEGAGVRRSGVGRDWTPESSPRVRLLHSWLQRLHALDRRRPALWDVTLTLLALPLAVMPLLDGTWTVAAYASDVPLPLLWFLSMGFVLPLLWRRRAPLTVLFVLSGVGVVSAWTGTELQIRLVQLVVLYGVAVRRRPSALACAGLLVALQSWITALRWTDGGLGNFLSSLVMCAFIAALGIAVRYRRDYTAALVERARRLETEHEQQALLAAAAERARIAREMHDIIGHNLSVITGLADGGGYAARRRPERAVEALDAIGTTSRQALGELRRLLDVLHEDAALPEHGSEPAARGPQPGLDDIEGLLERVRQAGMPVHCTRRGRPVPGTLSAGRQLTVYRVVQEALTNALKHARGPGAETTVALSYGTDGSISVTVTDTGTGAGSWSARVPGQSGRGIRAMRDRAALYDGTLEAGGPGGKGGGWRVRLSLPAERNRSSEK